MFVYVSLRLFILLVKGVFHYCDSSKMVEESAELLLLRRYLYRSGSITVSCYYSAYKLA
jgi:hypothetical protein